MEWLVTIKKTGKHVRVLADNAAHALHLARKWWKLQGMSEAELRDLTRSEEEETVIVALCAGRDDGGQDEAHS